MVSSCGMAKNTHTTECCSLSNGPLNQDDSVHFAQQFKVLADPARLRLLSTLCDEGCGPMSVSELTALSGLSQPTVSHHLAKLRDAGLLAKRQAGRTVTHEVQKEAFTALRDLLSFH
ncbi:ArsR/SmtB family transcription factor [Corynebacterium accolens]|uniref:ArsR/SmtB family transcription factor n=1 Tax=Corynebacterium accolens TaxID=38284 RepID=UPI002543F290|nr:metalloregulator ArsR/SmtB family transcription factor [Corynebacterium accolens]MDK4280252.1 metalloregulator ArsR/SmtB family transcription factor [Corynebacterium accolens]MDK8822003.1 metalloregulator ArsR/SmtB family transcription factor [Corynebacterium accolens]WKS63824.1 metalloregulator ArsR/SmtB family transcription factor [Corynebacterium accolens]